MIRIRNVLSLLLCVGVLLGCLAASALSGAVAATVFDLADFGGGEQALTALCAAMSAVILWGGAAWC